MKELEKKIYDWGKGYDDDDVHILKTLNAIIDGIYELESYGWDCIFNRMNVMLDYQKLIEDIEDDLDLGGEVAPKLEVIRALLFGGKVRYEALEQVLTENLDKYGYINPEKRGE